MAPSTTPLLLALVFSGALACTNSATPPDSTPVYAEEVAPGVAPIGVERLSVNRPEAGTITGPAPSEPKEQAVSPTSPEADPSAEETKETEPSEEGPQAEDDKTKPN